jgi:hypothetical protein
METGGGPPTPQVPKSDLCKLLVHGLPAALGAAAQLSVTYALGRAGAPPPSTAEPGSGPGQLLLVFPNPAIADAAFAALPGAAGADSVGRRQKQLELAGGAKVREGGRAERVASCGLQLAGRLPSLAAIE